MFGDTNQRHRHECTLVVVATACWQQRTFCAGLMRWSTPLRESRPARSAFLAKHSRETAASDSAPGTHGSGRPKLHTLRFRRVTRAAQPRAAQTAAGTAHLPKRSAAKNQN